MTDTFSACVINLGSTMLVTGGGSNTTYYRVIEYSETGYVRDLPALNQARYYHACSYFNNDQGTKVHSQWVSCWRWARSSDWALFQTFLVTGGMYWEYSSELKTNTYQYPSSTELLVESGEAWTFSGELPIPLSVTGCVSVDNRIFLAGFLLSVLYFYNQKHTQGGMDPEYNPRYEIFEFDTVTGQWMLVYLWNISIQITSKYFSKVDHLMQPRYQHTLSVVDDGAHYCDNTQRISLGTLLKFLE